MTNNIESHPKAATYYGNSGEFEECGSHIGRATHVGVNLEMLRILPRYVKQY